MNTPNPFTNGRRVADQFDPEEYHKPNAKRGDPKLVMSRGSLMEFAACPLDWLNSEPTLGLVDGEEPADEKESKALKWGSLIDCMVLDHERTDEKFSIQPAKYTNDKGEEKDWSNAAKVCKEWNADHADTTLISADMAEEAKKAVTRLALDAIAWSYLLACKKQVLCTADYRDEATGIVVPFKILIDLEPPKDHGDPNFRRSLGDFKTARNLIPKQWGRQVFDYDYHIQAKLYLDLYNAATSEARDTFRHVVQSNTPPYGVARRWVDEGFLGMGYDAYTAALRLYARCLATGVWPAMDDEQDGRGVILKGWRQTSMEAWMVRP